MRKKPNIKERPCEMCGEMYKPTGAVQKYCKKCAKERKREAEKRWELKKYPNRKPRTKCNEKCCVCGESFSCRFEGKAYCNKHYLRMKYNGTTELRGRKHGNEYRIEENTVIMTAKGGREFKIDKNDLDLVLRYTWCFSKTGYLVANIDKKVTKLQRYLLKPEKDMVVDHINGDPADNRRENLRVCTIKENARNVAKPKNSKSKYKGVRKTPHGRYTARIMVDRKEIHLGNFKTEEEAVEARIEAEKKYFGEFARKI